MNWEVKIYDSLPSFKGGLNKMAESGWRLHSFAQSVNKFGNWRFTVVFEKERPKTFEPNPN